MNFIQTVVSTVRNLFRSKCGTILVACKDVHALTLNR